GTVAGCAGRCGKQTRRRGFAQAMDGAEAVAEPVSKLSGKARRGRGSGKTEPVAAAVARDLRSVLCGLARRVEAVGQDRPPARKAAGRTSQSRRQTREC